MAEEGRRRTRSSDPPQPVNIHPPTSKRPLSQELPTASRPRSEDVTHFAARLHQDEARQPLAGIASGSQPPVPRGSARPVLGRGDEPVYVNTNQPPLPSRKPREASAALPGSHRPRAITIAEDHLPYSQVNMGVVQRQKLSSSSLDQGELSDLDCGRRRHTTVEPHFAARPPPVPQKAKHRPVSCADSSTSSVLGSPPDMPLSAPPSLTADLVSQQSPQKGQWQPATSAMSPFQRPGAPVPSATSPDDGYCTVPIMDSRLRNRAWTEESSSRRGYGQKQSRSAPVSTSEYLDPCDSLKEIGEYLDPADEYLDPADAFLSRDEDEYLDPAEELTSAKFESADSMVMSLPVHLECISEQREGVTASRPQWQDHSQSNAKGALDAEVHRYESLMKVGLRISCCMGW